MKGFKDDFEEYDAPMPVKHIFEACEICIRPLFDKNCYSHSTDSFIGKHAFEMMLLGTAYIFLKFRSERLNLYDKFSYDYLQEIYRFTKKFGLRCFLPCEFIDFVNNRLQFYGGQIQLILEGDVTYIPTKIAYNFYDTPMTLEGGIMLDLQKVMILSFNLRYFFKSLEECTDIMITTDYK